MAENKMLRIKDLRVVFPVGGKQIHAVNGVSVDLAPGEALGVIGESGCGKSVTFSSVLKLIQSPPAMISGDIELNGRSIMDLSEKEMQKIRGKEVSMIFQEPMRCLNPVEKIGVQIAESLRLHEGMTMKQALNRAVELLKMVEMPDAEQRIGCYPHQLSGGLRQRAMIAIALACSPKLLIADEPTTALDVTIQSQIIRLIQKLREETGMGIVFISHDMGVVASLVDRIAVFYAGQIVEQGNTRDIFRNPLHPYTAGLIKCIPRLDTESRRLYTIRGSTPNLTTIPEGCCFAPRCPYATETCRTVKPEQTAFPGGRSCACHHAASLN
ncbi:MAG: ABC transporter ATP-binding protein [Clostridia bacterium]|nr:ABC transporter ATP-binding protein [Clostridia bacterium]